MGVFVNLTGQRFGRLTVMGRTDNKKGRTMWICKCDCGKETEVSGSDLRTGGTKSCGCLRIEMIVERSTTHGMSNTRLHKEWQSMKDRCTREKCRDYQDYGGRGITICPEWSDSFEAFRDWALANGYRDDLTIDRIDVDGNYEPSNCRWATLREQAENKRNNHYLTLGEKTLTVTQWARETGIERRTLLKRKSLGWTDVRTLTEPVKAGRRRAN